ncbi:hypothetical protein CAEBREN_01165 [Caenorhabditis brenneri]|uniref:Uncharacterized protein n=1 Tax=Caenorhabditis brenneri TaxID=135651 RepID=G0NX39_CAEBE|nr:hypothetical protein CAEBREN_01165 [Caenorhabditis brenneri]
MTFPPQLGTLAVQRQEKEEAQDEKRGERGVRNDEDLGRGVWRVGSNAREVEEIRWTEKKHHVGALEKRGEADEEDTDLI